MQVWTIYLDGVLNIIAKSRTWFCEDAPKPNRFHSTFTTLVTLPVFFVVFYTLTQGSSDNIALVPTTQQLKNFLTFTSLVFSGFLRLHPSPRALISAFMLKLSSHRKAAQEDQSLLGHKTWLVSNPGHCLPISNLSKLDSGDMAPSQLPEPKILTPSSVFLHHSVSSDMSPFIKYLERKILMSSNLNSDRWPVIIVECS